jgi:ABC-type transporter Mla maintaining outer membrane lipid asymmetry ATPase subunit MlaF
VNHALRFRDVRAPVHGDVMGGPWSIEVEQGSFVAVVAAPSVAETVMDLCVGEAEPTSGTVSVLGEQPAALSRSGRYALLRRMGVAFQREGLVSNLTLEANLVVPLVFASGLPPTEARARSRSAMADLGLAAHAGRRPAELTREARIVAALARAALRRPELLILEQLTAGLPDALAERSLRWCRERCTTMLVLVPGPIGHLDRLIDGWIPPLHRTTEDGASA